MHRPPNHVGRQCESIINRNETRTAVGGGGGGVSMK
jgi:hypothetical protein